MQRMIEGVGLNSPDDYNQIWKDRKERGIDWFDSLRWKMLARRFKGGKLIDLGCLDSQVPFFAKKKFPDAEIWGLDQAGEVIDHLNQTTKDIGWIKGDVYQTLFPEDYFDYVVAGELIEHLEKPEKFFKEAFRILRRGGCLAVSTPLNEAVEPGAVDGDRHLWSFTKQDLKDLMYPYAYTTIKILGSRYFPVYKYAFPHLIAYGYKKL